MYIDSPFMSWNVIKTQMYIFQLSFSEIQAEPENVRLLPNFSAKFVNLILPKLKIH